jgi:ABC-2 type transport system permease protein
MTATTWSNPVPVAGPVRPGRVLQSERTKFRSQRSTWWTFATSTVLTIGIGVVATAAAAGERTSSALPADVATRAMLGVIFAQLALGTLAVLMIAGEYGTGMIRSSMAVVPRRLPVLWGKLAVYVAVVLPVSLLTSIATFLLGQLIWRGHHRTAVSLTDAHVPQVLVGAALYVTLAGVCALAIATMIRSTAGGITVVIGLFFVLPTVMQAMPARIAEASRFLPSNAGGAAVRLVMSPDSLGPWSGMALLCGYAAVLIAGAAWRLHHSDV